MDEMDHLGDIAHAVTPDSQTASPASPAQAAPPDATATSTTEAVAKFQSCRWRSDKDAGEFCTHRDVLPFAGKEGFKPDSWCPDCAFFKLRRTPKKRDRTDYGL